MSVLSARGVPVLMYHWVNPDLGDHLRFYGVTPEAFTRQIRGLCAAGYRSATLDELMRHLSGEAPLPPKRIVITLDDGYRDNLEYAGPVLEEAGFTATIFLVTDRAGGVNEWDLKHGDAPRPILDWTEARRLDGGVFRFEPHSRTHPELTRLDAARARLEIAGAKKMMEDQLGRPVSVFSYPHGEFHLGLEALVKEAGYAGAVTDLQGLNRPGMDPFRIRRTMVTSRDIRGTYAFKVMTGFGVMGLAREMARRAMARPAAWEQAGFA